METPETLTQSEFCEIFMNTFFTEHLQTTVFELPEASST